MNEPNPQEGITPASAGTPAPKPDGGIAPGQPPQPAPAEKKPYEKYDDDAAALPSLAKPGASEGAGLQSLAQSARGSQLNQARWTLIIIGILTVGANIYFGVTNRETVMQVLRQRGIQQVPPEVESALRLDAVVAGIFIVLGLVFIVLGMAIKAQPTVCATLGLVLYVVGFGVSVWVNPETIIQGIIVKVIIVVCLFRALQAARAYENEQREAEALA